MIKDLQALKAWGEIETTCKCGLIIKNSKKKTHIDNELCQILQTYDVENIRGTDKIQCKECKKMFTVCGFHQHLRTHQ